MDPELDSGTILYALGVLFGLAALAYFLQDVVFGLSITVRATLLLFAFLAFLVAGLVLERDVLDLVSFAFAGLAYVAFVWYVVARYDPGETATFLLLAASAGLFVALAYVLRERDPALPRRTALAVLGGLLLVSLLLVGADALGGGVVYETTLHEEVTVEPRDESFENQVPSREVSLGTATATNEFVFREPLEYPTLSGCVVGADGRVHRASVRLAGDAPPDTLSGYDTLSVPIHATVTFDADAAEPTRFAVERGTDCDVEREEPTLIVAVGERVHQRAV